jgi:hypothetical protein
MPKSVLHATLWVSVSLMQSEVTVVSLVILVLTRSQAFVVS